MHLADSNSMYLLLHNALDDSDYSCFQANFDEAALYGSDTRLVFHYNYYNQNRTNENDAELSCAHTLTARALKPHS